MTLARKLSLALSLCGLATIALQAAVSVERQLDLVHEDMVQDHRAVATSLRAAIEKAWAESGEAKALEVIRQANANTESLQIRWVWPNAPEGDPQAPDVPRSELEPLLRGTWLSVITGTGSGKLLHTFEPVRTEHALGALEITESYSASEKYVRSTIDTSLLSAVVLAVLFAVVASMLGRALVGRPVEQLSDLARRIGEGELNARAEFHTHDELSALGDQMNQMAAQLSESRQREAAAAAARIAALEQLRHADRLSTVGQLASGVAHELGTPLHVISLQANALAQDEEPKEAVQGSAEVIRAQAEQMTRIIQQLLDFARPRPPRKEREDLRLVVRQTTAFLGPLSSKKDVKLSLKEPPTPIELELDPGQIQQALTNLVVNAIQAIPGGGEVGVQVDTAELSPPPEVGNGCRKWARISVRDSGPGMSEEVRKRIFEPFFTTKEVGRGTGLGLSVAYGLVRDHGGWISVDSGPGAGSSFQLHLPLLGG